MTQASSKCRKTRHDVITIGHSLQKVNATFCVTIRGTLPAWQGISRLEHRHEMRYLAAVLYPAARHDASEAEAARIAKEVIRYDPSSRHCRARIGSILSMMKPHCIDIFAERSPRRICPDRR